MDPRLRAAVDASRCWYDDLFAVHGIPTATEDGVWWAKAEPPRWHSAAKSTAPHGAAATALRAVESFKHCSIADSFGRWDLSTGGFDLLFEATWLLTGGAVLHDCDAGTAGLWNCWTRPGTPADAEALLGCVAALRPGRGVVTYARGNDLDLLVELGFAPLGPQVVWLR